MTTPVVEDDVVERLRSRISLRRYRLANEPSPSPISKIAYEQGIELDEASIALIEQQRKTIEELTSDRNDMWKSLREIDCLAIDASRSSFEAAASGFIGSIVRITSRALLQGDKKE